MALTPGGFKETAYQYPMVYPPGMSGEDISGMDMEESAGPGEASSDFYQSLGGEMGGWVPGGPGNPIDYTAPWNVGAYPSFPGYDQPTLFPNENSLGPGQIDPIPPPPRPFPFEPGDFVPQQSSVGFQSDGAVGPWENAFERPLSYPDMDPINPDVDLMRDFYEDPFADPEDDPEGTNYNDFPWGFGPQDSIPGGNQQYPHNPIDYAAPWNVGQYYSAPQNMPQIYSQEWYDMILGPNVASNQNYASPANAARALLGVAPGEGGLYNLGEFGPRNPGTSMMPQVVGG
jgi:hypothetical protein